MYVNTASTEQSIGYRIYLVIRLLGTFQKIQIQILGNALVENLILSLKFTTNLHVLGNF